MWRLRVVEHSRNFSSQGYRVGIIDLTNGEPTPRCDDPAIRIAEAEAAAKVLGVHVRKILPFTNRRLFDGLMFGWRWLRNSDVIDRRSSSDWQQDTDGITGSLPGDADYRGCDFLFAADEMG